MVEYNIQGDRSLAHAKLPDFSLTSFWLKIIIRCIADILLLPQM